MVQSGFQGLRASFEGVGRQIRRGFDFGCQAAPRQARPDKFFASVIEHTFYGCIRELSSRCNYLFGKSVSGFKADGVEVVALLRPVRRLRKFLLSLNGGVWIG